MITARRPRLRMEEERSSDGGSSVRLLLVLTMVVLCREALSLAMRSQPATAGEGLENERNEVSVSHIVFHCV